MKDQIHFPPSNDRCYIIAEAGSNHNGSFEQALSLIDVACEAGADAVKFQTFRARQLYTRNAGVSDYLGVKKPIYDIIQDMEMPYDWIKKLSDYCHKKKIHFLSSVFDFESVDQVDPFVPVHKIASYEMNHIPLIEYVARKNKPVIISTGTADLDEVDETVRVFRKVSKAPLVLMQCTAKYPAPLSSLNVRAVHTLRERFRLPVGLSDHSRDPVIGPVTAVAQGASVIEKHFTLSNQLPGPDHPFALEPHELQIMVRRIREAEEALGNGEKVMLPVEKELRSFARRSIFTVTNIAKGEKITDQNIGVLRCGKVKGKLTPRDYATVLGKKAVRTIKADSALAFEDIK
ncbi:MAG: N-acetylneuraminate synthase family protein [Verrucomicrobiota bacterium]|nr:N-acetylneuraminate synthase family protein [Verrucomicrobiota bacterium]